MNGGGSSSRSNLRRFLMPLGCRPLAAEEVLRELPLGIVASRCDVSRKKWGAGQTSGRACGAVAQPRLGPLGGSLAEVSIPRNLRASSQLRCEGLDSVVNMWCSRLEYPATLELHSPRLPPPLMETPPREGRENGASPGRLMAMGLENGVSDYRIQGGGACQFCGQELPVSPQLSFLPGVVKVEEDKIFRLLDGTGLCHPCRHRLEMLPSDSVQEPSRVPIKDLTVWAVLLGVPLLVRVTLGREPMAVLVGLVLAIVVIWLGKKLRDQSHLGKHNAKLAQHREEKEKAWPIYEQWPDYPPDWKWRRQKVLERDNYACRYAGPECRRPLDIHHIQRVADGGNHGLSNLVTLCRKHHAEQPRHDHLGGELF